MFVENIVFNRRFVVNYDINADGVVDGKDAADPIGCYIYATEYIVGGMQSDTEHFYAPSKLIQGVLQNDPNVFNAKISVEDRILYRNIVNNSLQLRDYYTASTYYRMFIADMFLEYDKALYIDSDTVILNDIEKLFNKKIKDNYVGAITDGVVSGNEIFEKYTKEVLGIKAKRYFNAGVLIMNLKKFREENFYKQFVDLLRKYRFVVAQDQDYLNVICKDKIKYLANKWNTMPIKEKSKKSPSLIHYNLTLKPWHYLDIPYAEYFWKYAKESYYYDDIRKEFGNYNTQKIKSDEKTELSLLDLALSEIKKEDNYIKLVKKEQDTVSQFINQEGTVNQNAI